MNCIICTTKMVPAFKMLLLKKHWAQLYNCASCGLMQTEQPYWLDEAYSEAIALTDTGLVARNVENSKLLSTLLDLWFEGKGTYVDVAGGYGLLTRLMRDRGFEFWSIDKYCKSLFAPKYSEEIPPVAQCLFAFEVMEHLVNPIEFLSEYFGRYNCRTIIFSTQTYLGPPPNLKWWYYSPETGQHITFYQERTLERLAQGLRCQYFRIRNNVHLITDRPIPKFLLRCIGNKQLYKLLSAYVSVRRAGRSLTWTDHLVAKRELD